MDCMNRVFYNYEKKKLPIEQLLFLRFGSIDERYPL